MGSGGGGAVGFGGGGRWGLSAVVDGAQDGPDVDGFREERVGEGGAGAPGRRPERGPRAARIFTVGLSRRPSRAALTR